ncbi:hypothetical protein [Kitasatospora terrestris]|uniref:Uncharacterized protein n=1 Tax=Kitasatospora terrestris TaxID=258051 RepID=A0ABP9DMU0_9ACTN
MGHNEDWQDWQPPETEIRRVYQPVEIHREDGTWALGRINAWWQPDDGTPWCRVHALRTGEHWMPYDPERLLLLPGAGT